MSQLVCPFCDEPVCVTAVDLMEDGWGPWSAKAQVELWLTQHLEGHVEQMILEGSS